MLRRKTTLLGFTLIELMIVVSIIGILAAIATPAFINYVKKAKTAEVAGNLKAIFTGAASYYEEEHWPRGLLTAGMATASINCVPVGNSGVPSSVGPNKQIVDWSSDPTFKALNFGPADPTYYSYAFTNPDGSFCGSPASQQFIAAISAIGDLDGDAQYSLFEMDIGSNADNVLMRAPGIFKQNELE